jgi:hypothetical protein
MVPDGQVGETWGTSKKWCCFRNQEATDGRLLSIFVFKGLNVCYRNKIPEMCA